MTHFTGRDEAAVFICSLDSSVKKPHIFNFNNTSSNDSQLSLLLLQMKWDSITSQDCQSRDIFFYSVTAGHACVLAIFKAILGARPSQWSVGAAASGGETQTSSDTDTSGGI